MDKDGTVSYLLYFNDGTVAYRNNVKGCWFLGIIVHYIE